MIGDTDARRQGDASWKWWERAAWSSVGAIGGGRVAVGVGVSRLGLIAGALIIVIA